MKLKVPFYNQTTPLNCGPIALKMVLSYFGSDFSEEILESKTGIKEGKGISTIQIAIAAASLGYKADFYSKYILFNEDNLRFDFYKKYSEMDLIQSKKLVAKAKGLSVNINESSLPLDELLGFITQNSVPIILIDWNIVINKKDKGYQGHFVPVVGYDEKYVYIHNHGFDNPQEFLPVPRGLFDEARKADGTDEDIVVIRKR